MSAPVDLWWADLGAVPERQRRHARRALLRAVLARALGCDAADVVLRRTAAGRPELEWPRASVRFSVAASGPLGLVATTPGGAVGVDVELAERAAGLAGTAHVFLTAVERRRVAALAPAERDLAVLRQWTQREALGKAMGTGLLDLERLSGARGPWRSRLVPTASHVVAALATEGDGPVRQHRFVAPVAVPA
jgi:phosphopantetheinyl transferase